MDYYETDYDDRVRDIFRDDSTDLRFLANNTGATHLEFKILDNLEIPLSKTESEKPS